MRKVSASRQIKVVRPLKIARLTRSATTVAVCPSQQEIALRIQIVNQERRVLAVRVVLRTRVAQLQRAASPQIIVRKVFASLSRVAVRATAIVREADTAFNKTAVSQTLLLAAVPKTAAAICAVYV